MNKKSNKNKMSKETKTNKLYFIGLKKRDAKDPTYFVSFEHKYPFILIYNASDASRFVTYDSAKKTLDESVDLGHIKNSFTIYLVNITTKIEVSEVS